MQRDWIGQKIVFTGIPAAYRQNRAFPASSSGVTGPGPASGGGGAANL